MYNNDGFENGSSGIEYYENDTYGYVTDEQQEEDQDVSTFENVPTEGMWQEYCTLAYNNHAVTSVEYDSNVELLWASYDDGRVSSFSMKFDSSVEEYEQPQRHSSFMACEESILQLIPLQSCLISVSQSSIQMHSVGGLSLGKFCTCPSGLNDEGVETASIFTCVVAFRPPGGLVTAESVGPTHLLAGTSSNFVYVYDINMPGGSPLLVYDVNCRTVCVRASDSQLAVAGVDGKVRLLDSSLRNQSILHTFEAHSGPLTDLCLQPDGLTMLTCGVISRPINPFDPKSPINYVPDPLVKVFDLRSRRQLSPMSMSVSSPSFIKFMPCGSPARGNSEEASILLGSSTGVLQVCPVKGDPANTQIMYAPLTDRKDVVTTVTISNSGQLLCVGLNSGVIAQYSLGLPKGTKPKINATPLASSFYLTPSVRWRKLRLTSARRISDEVIKKTNQQDFIGTVPNIGFRPNSMLCGSAYARAYAVCDPRRREAEKGKSFGILEGGLSTGNLTGTASDSSYSVAAERQAFAAGGLQSQDEPTTLVSLIVPKTVKRVHSHRGKLKMKEFNYEALNRTPFVGLENTAPNAYTNPILQVFFAIPEVRECALAAQTATYHHNNATSLWCELGFLFHMMTAVEQCSEASSTVIQRVVTPSNFQRTFQQIPESAALGLLESREPTPTPVAVPGDTSSTLVASKVASSSSNGSNVDTQQMSQVFCRFLFQQLHREADLAILARNRTMSTYGNSSLSSSSPLSVSSSSTVAMQNTIDSVFGYSIATTTTFLQSGTIELGSANKAYSLEVVYPILGKNTNTRNPRPSPAISSSVTPSAVLACIAASREKAKDKELDITPAVFAPVSKEDTDPSADTSLNLVGGNVTSPTSSLFKSSGDMNISLLSETRSTDASVTPEPSITTEGTNLGSTSIIAAPAPGAVPSFSSVLWGSYQKETHMRGWCSASETYEPFKQVRSLLCLPKVLTLLCGDTVRDPRDATLSGALGEAQSYGSMHTNFWSQSVDFSHLNPPPRPASSVDLSCDLNSVPNFNINLSQPQPQQLKAPWLPVEIEIAVYRSHGTSTGSVYAQGRDKTGSQGSHMRSQGGTAGGRGAMGGKGDRDKLVISGRLLSTVYPKGNVQKETWTIFDGATETLANFSASRLIEYGIMSSSDGGGSVEVGSGWEVFRFSLFAAVSHVVTTVVPTTPANMATPASSIVAGAGISTAGTSTGAVNGGAAIAVEGPKHSILHIRRRSKGESSCVNTDAGEWWMFNDFVLQPSEKNEAVSFSDWRHPSTLFFGREDYEYDAPGAIDSLLSESKATIPLSAPQIVPSSVLLLPSLSQTACVRLVTSTGQAGASGGHTRGSGNGPREKEREEDQYQLPPLPSKGELVAFDGEFVSVQAERVVLNAEGQKVTKEEGRMSLARISIISDDGVAISSSSNKNKNADYRLLVDDYILPSEPVIDYVTRFSGIVPEDLNPSQSRHAVVPYRTAYLKLRFFLDRGCIFVGHGLQKDFETANIFVPPDQVLDTVELWRLPNQRKASLRFLAAYLLRADIQDEVHDSIEDAKTALLLYRHYERTSSLGPEHLHATLQDLYAYGARTNWTIGLDKLND